jgi:hypothetical protein
MVHAFLHHFVDALGDAAQEGIHVETGYGGGEEADRGQDREAATDIGEIDSVLVPSLSAIWLR